MAKRLKTIALQTATYLMTAGNGERASALVLMTDDKRDLGGWGIGPLAQTILRALEEAAPKPTPKKARAKS